MFSFSLEGLIGGVGVGNKLVSFLEVSFVDIREFRYFFSGEERGDFLMLFLEEDLELG